jgi:hypothetical protein
MTETRTVRDPFLGKDVQVSDRLVDRLRGRYACGPTLPNGEPEFGWRQYDALPIQIEAAAEIERLTDEVALCRGERDAADEVSRTGRRLVEELEKQVYVPGLWRCAKCKFTLMQANLHAQSGAVKAMDRPGEKCPNCDSPLWRVTERQAGNYMVDRCEEQMKRVVAAEAEVELLRAALQGMFDNFKPFTLKPVGSPNSSARGDQEAQIEAYSKARSALGVGGIR